MEERLVLSSWKDALPCMGVPVSVCFTCLGKVLHVVGRATPQLAAGPRCCAASGWLSRAAVSICAPAVVPPAAGFSVPELATSPSAPQLAAGSSALVSLTNLPSSAAHRLSPLSQDTESDSDEHLLPNRSLLWQRNSATKKQSQSHLWTLPP